MICEVRGVVKIQQTSYAQGRKYKHNQPKESMKSNLKNRGFSHHFILPVLVIIAVVAIGITTLNLSSASSKTYTVAKCKSLGIRRTGSTGSCVRVLQKVLNKSGAKLSVDGSFGGKTRDAVKKFQRDHKLKVDGVVGVNTWNALSKVPGAGNVSVKVTVKSAANSDSKAKPKTTTQTPKASPLSAKDLCKRTSGIWSSGLNKCVEYGDNCTFDDYKATGGTVSLVNQPGYFINSQGNCRMK